MEVGLVLWVSVWAVLLEASRVVFPWMLIERWLLRCGATVDDKPSSVWYGDLKQLIIKTQAIFFSNANLLTSFLSSVYASN